MDNDNERWMAGMDISIILRELNNCIARLQMILPTFPHNRELSVILEQIRETHRRLTIEYGRLIEGRYQWSPLTVPRYRYAIALK